MIHYPLAPHAPSAYAMGAHAPLPLMSSQEFVKGFVMTACLASLDGMPGLKDKTANRRVLRRALQGGVALSSADAAARAAVRGDYTRALTATSVGAVGVFLIERLLPDAATPSDSKERKHG